MDGGDRGSVQRIRFLIERGLATPSTFRAALLEIAPQQRDAWLNLVLDLGELPEDGPELPRGCVPYLPCSVDALLRMIDGAEVRSSDVFVDVGSGVGRAAAFVHLLTGAAAIGVEIQPRLAHVSRDLASRLPVRRVSTVEGDATQVAGFISVASVFFLYCPFSGERLSRLLAALEPVARTRMLRICCVDVALPPLPWLMLEPQRSADLAIYRTLLHEERFVGCVQRNEQSLADLELR
jgi:SAM-dependent methyltransferase